MKLYELADEFNQVVNEIELIDDQVAMTEKLNEIQLPIKEKAINVAKYIEGLKSNQVVLDTQIERLTKIKKVIKHREEWLRDYLDINMRKCGITEIDSPLFKIKFQKCPCSVNILDADEIPDEYKKVKREVVIDKVKIKEDLKVGVYIPGVSLVQNEKLTIK